MSIAFGSLKPKALIYGLATDIEVNDTLLKYGVENRFQADPRAFLYALHECNPAICFIVVEDYDLKNIHALLKSIRNVLGVVLPMYAVVKSTESTHVAALIESGATGVLLRPFDGPLLIDVLRKYVVTGELARAGAVREIISSVESGASSASDEGLMLESVTTAQGDVHAIATWIFEKVLPVMATVSSAFENLDEIESRVKFYAERIAPYEKLFTTYVNSLRKSADEQPLNLPQCVRFYGLVNARVLVVANQLFEGLRGEGGGIKWDETTGRPVEDPKKMLTYSFKFLEHFGDDSIYKEAAFNSGLVFDLLNYYADSYADRKNVIKKDIEARARKVTEHATAGIKKAKSFKTLPLARHIVTTHAMAEAGKILLGMMLKDYADFTKGLEKAKVKPRLWEIAEQARYGVTSNLLGAMLCQVTPGLSDAASAVLFLRHPYMLIEEEGKVTDLSSLADICSTT